MSLESDIFEWEELLEISDDFLQFGHCTFIRDFGPWTEGDTAEVLCLHLADSELYEYDGEDVIKTCKVKLVPIS